MYGANTQIIIRENLGVGSLSADPGTSEVQLHTVNWDTSERWAPRVPCYVCIKSVGAEVTRTWLRSRSAHDECSGVRAVCDMEYNLYPAISHILQL